MKEIDNWKRIRQGDVEAWKRRKSAVAHRSKLARRERVSVARWGELGQVAGRAKAVSGGSRLGLDLARRRYGLERLGRLENELEVESRSVEFQLQ
jgi:hypothetical protein